MSLSAQTTKSVASVRLASTTASFLDIVFPPAESDPPKIPHRRQSYRHLCFLAQLRIVPPKRGVGRHIRVVPAGLVSSFTDLTQDLRPGLVNAAAERLGSVPGAVRAVRAIRCGLVRSTRAIGDFGRDDSEDLPPPSPRMPTLRKPRRVGHPLALWRWPSQAEAAPCAMFAGWARCRWHLEPLTFGPARHLMTQKISRRHLHGCPLFEKPRRVRHPLALWRTTRFRQLFL